MVYFDESGYNFMRISIDNIGKICKASIEINGITVIAGENNTGKSTIGRALFSVFNSFYNINERIESDRKQSIYEAIKTLFSRNSFYTSRVINFSHALAKHFLAEIDKYKKNFNLIKQDLLEYVNQLDKKARNIPEPMIEETASRINEIINIPDESILKSVFERTTNAEFNGQIVNIFSENRGEIKLEIQGNPLSVTFANNGEIISIDNFENLSFHTQAIYIDDPFVIDELASPNILLNFGSDDHRSFLKEKLSSENDNNFVNEIIAENRINNIYNKIDSVCSGRIIPGKPFGYVYKRIDSDKNLEIKNLSTGLKTFAILKTLLFNGTLEFGGIIILDEPEIHLHPEWQLIFAEIIVLLQKEFNLHILLNTHSPYFLEAIEVYSERHNVADKCKYYLSSVTDNVASIEDVTNCIEKIYQKMGKPFQDLENERYADD